MANGLGNWIRVAATADLDATERLVVHAAGHTLLLVRTGGKIFAIDNRCPHMGFPLSRGSEKDCILTCHWHHARFDLATGGTFDQWADDVRAFPVDIREDAIWIDVSEPSGRERHQQERLRIGLERNIPLVLAKGALSLLAGNASAVAPFRVGLEFGTRNRQEGWGAGLTVHTCMMNIAPFLDPEDRPLALYHGLSAVARDCDCMPPRFGIPALPAATTDLALLKRWFRQFIEVRDAEGAERCLVSALRAGANAPEVADMLFAAATDHRFINVGHVLDFTNKAFEALDAAGREFAEPVLSSLVTGYASASRMEESNAWRHPIDLIGLLEAAFDRLPSAMEKGEAARVAKADEGELITVLLDDDPGAILDALLNALRTGWSPVELAASVTRAAVLRIAQFPTTNEFGDWDTAHHTFTFANAVQEGLRRTRSPELVRGVLDAAMSVYLDRFLNVPATPLPVPESSDENPEALLRELPAIFDRQQQVQEAAESVARYLAANGDPARLMAVLGKLLLREDRDFHTVQMVEAAFRQHQRTRGTPAGIEALIAAARYLAAHAPTVRSQLQTYDIARRLHGGDHLYEERSSSPSTAAQPV